MDTEKERKNLLRILIATDNHLGVWEKDNVRKDDSFETFEEIFQLAQSLAIDFVLLGGDLFHDNKPSRSTLIRAVETLMKHCLHDRPVSFQVLSDRSAFERKCVNFEDPNLNVGLPVFTIHGNHDDPSGEGNLSSVDVLSSSGLVNYWGKVTLSGSHGPGKIRLAPVLLQKGDTKVALYGIGHIRDERLGRLFQTPGCVEWVRPKEIPGYPADDWFNIFVLHQNRVQHGQHAKNCIQEKCLARFLDLVIWGHEHECIPDPEESTIGGFSILQPGSSVATALSEGESKPKHVVLLEILGEKWRTVKYPLETVRPFEYAQVTLADEIEVDCEKPDTIKKFLEHRVEDLIKKALRERPPLPGKPRPLPLIRIRVDYTGCPTISSQIFGQMFVGKVANPHDLLLWIRAPKRNREAHGDEEAVSGWLPADENDHARMDDLIAATLQHNLEILPEDELTNALHIFIDKDEKGALAAVYNASLAETQKAAAASDEGQNIQNIEQAKDIISKHVKDRQSKKDLAAGLDHAANAVPGAAVQSTGNVRGRGAAAAAVVDERSVAKASASNYGAVGELEDRKPRISSNNRNMAIDEDMDDGSPRPQRTVRKSTRASRNSRSSKSALSSLMGEIQGGFISSDDDGERIGARTRQHKRGRRKCS